MRLSYRLAATVAVQQVARGLTLEETVDHVEGEIQTLAQSIEHAALAAFESIEQLAEPTILAEEAPIAQKSQLAHTKTSTDHADSWEKLFGDWVDRQNLTGFDDQLYAGSFQWKLIQPWHSKIDSRYALYMQLDALEGLEPALVGMNFQLSMPWQPGVEPIGDNRDTCQLVDAGNRIECNFDVLNKSKGASDYLDDWALLLPAGVDLELLESLGWTYEYKMYEWDGSFVRTDFQTDLTYLTENLSVQYSGDEWDMTDDFIAQSVEGPPRLEKIYNGWAPLDQDVQDWNIQACSLSFNNGVSTETFWMTQEDQLAYTVVMDKRIVRTQTKYFQNGDASEIYPAQFQFNDKLIGADTVQTDGWTVEDGAVVQVKLDHFICGANYFAQGVQLLAWAPKWCQMTAPEF